MDTFFVVNPASSAGRTARLWRAIGGGLPCSLTRGPGHAAELTADALGRGAGLVVVVGGDGTLNEALNGFFAGGGARDGAALAVVPSGTGGDLARTLGLHGIPPERLLRGLVHGRRVRLDCAMAAFRGPAGPEQRRFLNVASVGFSAVVARRVNRKAKLLGGKLAFLSAVLRSIAFLRNERMSVAVDGRELYEGPVLLAAVANGRFFGGSMMIAPEAEPTDSLLDVVIVAGLSRREVLRHVGKLYSGRHVSLPQVRVARGRSVSILCRSDAPLEMDGELPGSLDATFTVEAAAVPFILPSLSPR